MKNSDFMITGVSVPGARERVIEYLLDLMNKKYQMEKWLDEEDQDSFRYNIHFAFELLVEDLLEDYIDSNTLPVERIGEYIKTEEEAKSLLETTKKLDKIVLSCRNNQEYLSSPYLSPMRKAAKNCFVVFMENEKENKEFCEFVLKIIEKDYAYKADPAKSAYENIVAYSNSIIEF